MTDLPLDQRPPLVLTQKFDDCLEGNAFVAQLANVDARVRDQAVVYGFNGPDDLLVATYPGIDFESWGQTPEEARDNFWLCLREMEKVNTPAQFRSFFTAEAWATYQGEKQ